MELTSEIQHTWWRIPQRNLQFLMLELMDSCYVLELWLCHLFLLSRFYFSKFQWKSNFHKFYLYFEAKTNQKHVILGYKQRSLGVQRLRKNTKLPYIKSDMDRERDHRPRRPPWSSFGPMVLGVIGIDFSLPFLLR